MKVFKFGGASVKDAEAVRNMARILKGYCDEKLVVVVSAMGKTTNSLEKVMSSWYLGSKELESNILELETYHEDIIRNLFPDQYKPVYLRCKGWMDLIRNLTHQKPSGDFDFDYDQLVSIGELISTSIVQEYLLSEKIDSRWFDVRKLILTDDSWREAKIDWETTSYNIQQALFPLLNGNCSKPPVIITQGFLGCTAQGKTTTLGREGSDYTAAIFAYSLDAGEMIIWKDVPGLLNADPKYFSKTEKLSSISYREAIELAYYGATIIHPKTIKPLQNKNIPLLIKSFLHPELEGSLIHQNTASDSLIPSFIFKVNQVLVSISPRDFSFIDEQNLSDILAIFADHSIHIHLMQNSAISFSVCVDDNERRLKLLFNDLGTKYNVRYNEGLELITIRHYDQATIDRVMEDGKTILLEMRSRITAQFVVKPSVSAH
jgi:aspartate kinase